VGGLFEKERNAGWLNYFLTSPVFLGLDTQGYTNK